MTEPTPEAFRHAGELLAEWLSKKPERLPRRDCWSLTRAIAAALDEAEQRGINKAASARLKITSVEAEQDGNPFVTTVTWLDDRTGKRIKA